MKKSQNEALEELILYKVKLFTKENYFRYFKYILLELTKNSDAFRKKKTLSNSLSSILIERNNNLSNWMLIYKLIFQLKKEIHSEKEINLNPLCFQYLKALCFIKMKNLTNISNDEIIPLNQVIYVYLNLCEKQIKINKEEEQGNFMKYEIYFRQKDNRKSIIRNKNNILNKTQIKLNRRKLGAKKGPISKPLNYNNSFTRLFIGETDKDSIRERYLSNMAVKKQKQLHLSNAFGELSLIYLKNMYKKLFENKVRLNCDKDMIKVVKQFENDYRLIDNFQRSEILNSNNNSKIKHNNQKDNHIKKSGIKFRFSLGLPEITKNNSQEIGLILSNSSRYKSKSFHHSAHGKNKLKDSSEHTAREINEYKAKNIIDNNNNINISNNNKLKINLTDKKLKRNFSFITMKSKSKLKKKRYNLINYLNKKDFFFS